MKLNKRNLKSNKAITLIALVITIVLNAIAWSQISKMRNNKVKILEIIDILP